MADKMMRVSGRGDDGNAKAIKTNDSGNLDFIEIGDKKKITTFARAKTSGDFTENNIFKMPKNAKFINVSMRIISVVGDYEPDEGLRIIIDLLNTVSSSSTNYLRLTGDWTSEVGSHQFFIGIDPTLIGDATLHNDIKSTKYTPLPLFSDELKVTLQHRGSTGNEIDCMVDTFTF